MRYNTTLWYQCNCRVVAINVKRERNREKCVVIYEQRIRLECTLSDVLDYNWSRMHLHANKMFIPLEKSGESVRIEASKGKFYVTSTLIQYIKADWISMNIYLLSCYIYCLHFIYLFCKCARRQRHYQL